MDRRVFIVAFQAFPRGSAGANYIQYLALAFMDAGYESYIIGPIRSSLCEKSDGGDCKYKGIHAINVFSSNRIVRSVEQRYLQGRIYLKTLKKLNTNAGDIIITYSTNRDVLKKMLTLSRKRKIKSGACLVEWLTMDVFESKREYTRYIKTLTTVMPKFDVIFPISNYIASKYEKLDSKHKILTLPIMADVGEYKYVDHKCEDELNFIFPANGKMKDSIYDMILGVAQAAKKSNRKIKFHITNYKEEAFNKLLETMPIELKKLSVVL